MCIKLYRLYKLYKIIYYKRCMYVIYDAEMNANMNYWMYI